MKKTLILFTLMLTLSRVSAQVEKNIYELNQTDKLLTADVEGVLNRNLKGNKLLFLGESNHYFGSDLTAKTEFVKYLVLKEGYKDIVFEDDFFALYFDHDKKNLHSFWANSTQCKDLFTFLKEHKITIWGFDNQTYSEYTRANFLNKLVEFLNENAIVTDKEFIDLTDTFFKNASDIGKTDGKQNIDKLINGIDRLLKEEKVAQNKLWYQILENYKSFIMIVSTHKGVEKGTPIRDNQMAKNLDFLIKEVPDKKYIVWLHNAHMIKDDYGTIPGQTMGYQFTKLNPDISYHIATSSIYMPYRKPKKIEKYSNDTGNLLSFLPSTEKNYFIDSKQIIRETPDYAEKEYDGMFVVRDIEPKTNWFKHYDALVFISKGEDMKIIK